MSESSNEQTTEQSSETPDVGLIPDEDLPEDLQPEKNPLAADPDDESDDPATVGRPRPAGRRACPTWDSRAA